MELKKKKKNCAHHYVSILTRFRLLARPMGKYIYFALFKQDEFLWNESGSRIYMYFSTFFSYSRNRVCYQPYVHYPACFLLNISVFFFLHVSNTIAYIKFLKNLTNFIINKCLFYVFFRRICRKCIIVTYLIPCISLGRTPKTKLPNRISYFKYAPATSGAMWCEEKF